MPHKYRVQLTVYDAMGNQVDTLSHEEMYRDDQDAKRGLKEKEIAARKTGHGTP
ncbi:MAG TPA: hypothetical protein VFT27_06840 [Actinomycetota bacterium]|nr:hypothetical protein [Actinomycetota bacterium]